MISPELLFMQVKRTRQYDDYSREFLGEILDIS